MGNANWRSDLGTSLYKPPNLAQRTIFQAMTRATNEERLLVTMLLRSAKPLSMQHLEGIEADLRQMFPPATRSSLTPDRYMDFQASAVRFYFNRETRAVRSGALRDADRLWENPKRGRWRNTRAGNDYALRILRQNEIKVVSGSSEMAPSCPDDSPVQAQGGHLGDSARGRELADVDLDESAPRVVEILQRVIENLPALGAKEFSSRPETELSVGGTPSDVGRLLEAATAVGGRPIS